MAIMNDIAANIIRILNRPFSAYQKMPMPQMTSRIKARINRKPLMMFSIGNHKMDGLFLQFRQV